MTGEELVYVLAYNSLSISSQAADCDPSTDSSDEVQVIFHSILKDRGNRAVNGTNPPELDRTNDIRQLLVIAKRFPFPFQPIFRFCRSITAKPYQPHKWRLVMQPHPLKDFGQKISDGLSDGPTMPPCAVHIICVLLTFTPCCIVNCGTRGKVPSNQWILSGALKHK